MEQPGLTLEELEQKQQYLLQQLAQKDLLLRTIQQLSHSFDLADTLPAVLETAREFTAADATRIIIVEDGGLAGYECHDVDANLAHYDHAALNAIRDSREPITLNPADNPDFAALRSHFSTLTLWPVADPEGAILGVLTFAYNSTPTTDPATDQFLQALIAQLAGAIDRARSYQLARNGRKWLETILSSTADPVLAVDNSGRISMLNHASETLLDVDNRAVLKRPVTEVLAAYPELLKFFQRENVLADDAEWEGPDGRVFSPRFSPVESDSGASNGSVLTLRDVTTFQLLNRNQAEFVRLVSHDLRSPLTFMKGFADLVGMVGELNDQQAEFMEKVLSGIHQITTLVDNIQDAGRWDPQTGFYEMNREPADLTRTLGDIISNHHNHAAKNGIQLTADIAPGIPIVSVDNLMIERALINLVMNAIKYSPDGGEVRAAMEVKDNAILICISDTGLGIAPENAPNLFKRGTRIVTEETKKNRIKGSGLGLFIVRSVARRHGGDAWVTSQLGKGSQFYFSIPLEGANLVGSS